MFYKGKSVWIVGASSGIGRALAIELSKQYADIIISSRNEKELFVVKETCENNGSKCAVIPLDLMNIDSFQEKVSLAISQYNRIDYLILNGGISQRSYIKDTSIEIDKRLMDVNYFGNIALAKAVLPTMIKQKSGHIATVSSIVGVFGFPLRSAYAASKHALHGFYETLRAEHKNDGLLVSVIIPGRVKTNISMNAIDEDGNSYNKLDKGQAKAMSAEKAAKKILIGLKRKKKEINVGGAEILMVYIRRYLPFVFYRIVNKIKKATNGKKYKWNTTGRNFI